MYWDPVELTQKRRDARIGGGRVGRVDGRAGGVNSECLIGCTGPRRRRQEQNRDGFQLRVDTRVILVTRHQCKLVRHVVVFFLLTDVTNRERVY